MGISDARGKVVAFRLSPDEYEHVQLAAELGGARSISDFARVAVLDRADSATVITMDMSELRRLNDRSEEMFRMLLELRRSLAEVQEGSARVGVGAEEVPK